MARSPQEVFRAHGAALDADDVDAVAADYAEDALLITADGVVRGRDGIRTAFAGMLGHLPAAAWEFPVQHFVDDVLFLRWTAVSEKARAEGVDTFVFADGYIRVQTISFTLEQLG
jgi:hypothetical protein